jgi:two-component system, OmpR family, response regulator
MNKNNHILLAEDDASLGFLVKENLEAEGFNVSLSDNGKDAVSVFKSREFHLCILDIMLPRQDGFELAKQIRELNQHIPIIFLTAKTMEVDKVKAFQIGADDYVVKPFSIKELLLRIRAILRRTKTANSKDTPAEILQAGAFRLDYVNRVLLYKNIEKFLSQREVDLLYILFENKGQQVSRTYILNKVWGSYELFNSRTLDVYLTKIRKLLKDDPTIEIQNFYGTGYRLLEKPQK